MRCEWANQNEKMVKYHDEEYGVLTRDTSLIYEHLCLEIMCTGLSFNTALQKRDTLKVYFANYNLKQIAQFDEEKFQEGMKNEGIVRNELKIRALINNAKIMCKIEEKYPFYDYLIMNLDYQRGIEVLIKKLVKQLKKDGFRFMGPSVVESLLIALGIIPGHMGYCEYNRNRDCGSFAIDTEFGVLVIKYDNYFEIISSELQEDIEIHNSSLTPIEEVIKDKIYMLLDGKIEKHQLCLKFEGTEFQKAVMDVVVNSKPGSLMTYKDIGLKINSDAYRAVGTVLHNNKFKLLVPAYRVVTGQAIKKEELIPDFKMKFILAERENYEKNI